MSLADALRWFCAGTALALLVSCIYCTAQRIRLDQRIRFLSTGLIAIVIVGGQLDALGNPPNWRMPILALGIVLNLAAAFPFLRRARRDDTDREPGS